MDRTAWQALHRVSRTKGTPASLSRAKLKRIMGVARPYRTRIIIFVIISVLVSIMSVITPVLAGDVINAITDGGSENVVVRLSLIIAALAVAGAALGITTQWLSSTIGEGLIYQLRTAVYDHVQKQPIAFFTRTRTGALVSRLNNDVIGAQAAFAGTLSNIVSNFVTVLLTLAVMFRISWVITLIALIMLPIFVLPTQRMGARLALLQRDAANYNASMSTQMTERFSAPGAILVKLFGRPADELGEFSSRAALVRDIGVRTSMLRVTFMTALTLVSSLALAVVYGLGGVYALRGQLDAGAVVTLSLLLTRLYSPLINLAGARVDIMSAVVSFDRVFEVLDLRPMITEKPDARTVPPGPVSVEFDHVSFTYPTAQEVSLASLETTEALESHDQAEVLHDVSFAIQPGRLTAIVGSSGAGKSSIAQLLPRLYDVNSGAVRLSGVDVRDLTFASIRETVGMVSQDGHLFHDTIRANLLLARPDATDQDIWDALRRARLEPLIASLPAGLDTVVGERGYRFSGGERQRLTIARLLLAQPWVVILDEATAHLDSTSEAAVQAALAEALRGRTALVIAHRLSTIQAADEIIVLEAGRVVERGTHQELLARDGRYRELYLTQSLRDRESPDSHAEVFGVGVVGGEPLRSVGLVPTD